MPPEKHSLFSPSGAKRWMACPASTYMSKGYEDTTSDAAEEGRTAHEVAEYLIRHPQAEEAEVLYKVSGSNADMITDTADYVAFARSAIDTFGPDTYGVEQRVEIASVLGKGEGGTVDFWYVAGNTLHVADLKYGRGVQVSAEENPQLMLYAVGLLDTLSLTHDIKEIVLMIFQPRRQNNSEWSCSVEYLREFEKRAQVAIGKGQLLFDSMEVLPEDFCPGESQCRWCRHLPDCEAAEGYVAKSILDDFEDLTQPEAQEALQKAGEKIAQDPQERIGKLLGQLEYVRRWCDAIEIRARLDLEAGKEVPGWKLVEGRLGARQWSDEDEAAKMLESMRLKKEERYTLKLISPTAAEKLLGKNKRKWSRVSTLITRKDGKPLVVPESDKRPAMVVASVEDYFQDETQFDDLIN